MQVDSAVEFALPIVELHNLIYMPLHESPAISLRAANRHDFDRLFSIHRAAIHAYVDATWGWDDEWQAKYFREHFDQSIRQVICREGDVIGFLDILNRSDSVFLQNIEISPEHQGQGIGTELIRRLLTDAEKNGMPVRLQVLKVNRRARALYDRMGFVQTAQTDTHYEMERPYVASSKC